MKGKDELVSNGTGRQGGLNRSRCEDENSGRSRYRGNLAALNSRAETRIAAIGGTSIGLLVSSSRPGAQAFRTVSTADNLDRDMASGRRAENRVRKFEHSRQHYSRRQIADDATVSFPKHLPMLGSPRDQVNRTSRWGLFLPPHTGNPCRLPVLTSDYVDRVKCKFYFKNGW